MTCPICGSELCEKERRETTSGTLISIRCTDPGCNYFDYKKLATNPNEEIAEIKK
jgi:hypothetical protein